MEPRELEEKREEVAQEEATQEQKDYSTPVAYGPNGEPLYAHPIEVNQQGPQFVHMSRSVDPVKPTLPPELQQKHDDSVQQYPALNISEQEYVIAEVRRHPLGLLSVVIVTALIVVAVYVIYFLYSVFLGGHSGDTSSIGVNLPTPAMLFVPFLILEALVILGGFMTSWVYRQNKFYLTNESVIQEIQTSLFSHDEQTISLANVEDVSFQQNGIFANIFGYGSIRMSTEGDETTYQFTFVAHPKDQAALLNNAVEAFKNGRPVDPNA